MQNKIPDMPDISGGRLVLFFLFLLMAVAGLYYPVLNAPFLFDDYPSILNNTAIRSLDLQQIYDFKPLRFVGYLSFALNFYFSKLDPFSYHLVNIIIHTGYCFFGFLLIDTLWQTPSGKAVPLSDSEKRAVSLGVVAVIALHPVSTFAVSYVVQRLASLTALLYVITLLCYLKARLCGRVVTKILYALTGLVFLSGALFSKENAFTIFPQIFFMELLCFQLTRWRRLVFGLCVPVAAMAIAMTAYYNLIDLNEVNRLTIETSDITRKEYLLTQFSVICFYLKTFLVPLHLAMDYNRYILDSLTDPNVFVPGLILVFILGFTTFLATTKTYRLAAFGLVFYFVAASIESSIIPIRDIKFLHRVYLPNLGLAFAVLLLGYLFFKRLGLSAFSAVVVFCLWVGVLSGFTYRTNQIFKSPVTAWERVLEISPDNFRAYQSLGNHYVTMENQGATANFAKAQKYILTVHEQYPDHPRNLNNLGILFNRENRHTEAIACFERVIQLKPKNGIAYANLGITYFNLGQYEKAIEILEKGYQAAPEEVTLLGTYGQVLAILAPGPESQYEKAVALLDAAKEIHPRDPVLFYSSGLAWFNLADVDKSQQEFETALEIDPSFQEARDFLDKIQQAQTGA